MGHPDNENQSYGRTKTTDSKIFKSSQSDVWFETMKSQLIRCDAYATAVSLVNCQAQAVRTFALENIVLLYSKFYIDKHGKLITLTVFHSYGLTFMVVV